MYEEKRIELVYDHYKDSGIRLSDEIRARLRYLSYIFVILGLMVLEMYQPGVFLNLLQALMKKSTDVDSGTLGLQTVIGLINTVLWMLLAYLLLQSYLRSLEIERYARYLRWLEEELEKMLRGNFINRERAFKAPFFGIASLAYIPMFLLSVVPVILVKFYHEAFDTLGKGILRWTFTLIDALMLAIIFGFGAAFVISFRRQTKGIRA